MSKQVWILLTSGKYESTNPNSKIEIVESKIKIGKEARQTQCQYLEESVVRGNDLRDRDLHRFIFMKTLALC